MEKPSISQTISVAANLGVIVGLLFLALEIEQNNRLLRAEALASLVEARNLPRVLMMQDPEFAEFWLRVESGEPLSPTDARRFRAYAERGILNWAFQYEQYLEGNLLESQLPIEGWRSSLSDERWMEAWRGLEPGLAPEFVEFVEGSAIRP